MDPQQRRAEILAKKEKLAELKRQRELRRHDLTASTASTPPELASPTPDRADSRKELDSLISSLVGEGRPSRPSSTGPGEAASPAGARGSRPTSVTSATQLSGDNAVTTSSPSQAPAPAAAPQTLSIAPATVLFETPASPTRETVTYSKAVQTSEPWSPQRQQSTGVGDSDEGEWSAEFTSPRKRLSRRERERDEELREQIRKEIEEEQKALQQLEADAAAADATAAAQIPVRTLTEEELNAVSASEDFLDFVERSTKYAERTLEEKYDVLADYASGAVEADDEDDGYGTRGKKARRVREIAQFWDERWSKNRMISSLGFSPKFPELILASYTKNPKAPSDPFGLIQIWNQHMPSRPEYIFHSASEILTAKFSPFHPHLIVGGAYSGQVLLWDTRAKSPHPVQKTPLTGAGHTHPVYALDVVGTQNAHTIVSVSTDGAVRGWTVDMLSHPAEFLELTAPPPSKTEDLAPTCLAFPPADPTYFLAGAEDGGIYPVHRYDRAGAKAGVDGKVAYRGHTGPVMAVDFHTNRGPLDLGDLALSASVDWSVRLWKVRPAAAGVAAPLPPSLGAGLGGLGGLAAVGGPSAVRPLFEWNREDLVYDVRWSPVKPGVFALVDGMGSLEVWDVGVDTEVPVAKVSPTDRRTSSFLNRSLNKCAWEPNEGRRVAVGGLDGVVTVFEVGDQLGGLEGGRAEDWAGVRKWVERLEKEGAKGAVDGL